MKKTNTLYRGIKFLLLLALTGGAFKTSAQCVASFTTASSGVSYTFQSTSTGVNPGMHYNWAIDNSMYFNMGPTVTHSFPGNGVYVASLTIVDSLNNPLCFSPVTQTIVITNGSCAGSPSIYASLQQGGLVNFYGSAGVSGLYTYSWIYGDGGTGSGQNPSHTYTANGAYNVMLTVASPSAICVYSVVQTVSVTIFNCTQVAAFTFTVNNSLVNFSNTSSGSSSQTTYWWSFGDGNGSALVNPSHTYTNSGSYIVHLNLYDSAAVNPACMWATDSALVVITNTTCPTNAGFNLQKDTLVPLTWNLFPLIPGNATNVLWSWGDGSSSSSMFPSHTYSAAGTYSICLSVTVACGSSTTFCSSSSIYRSSQNNAMVKVNVINPKTVGVPETTNELNGLRIYPNPSAGTFMVETSAAGQINISVKNLLGAEVYQGEIVKGKMVSLPELSAGTYFIKVTSETGEVNKKILITK